MNALLNIGKKLFGYVYKSIKAEKDLTALSRELLKPAVKRVISRKQQVRTISYYTTIFTIVFKSVNGVTG